MWDRIAKFFRNKPPPEPVAFEADEAGVVSVHGGTRTALFRWKDLHQVTAYKVDLFGRDLIVIRFVTSEDGAAVEIDEEQIGYEEVVRVMDEQLPGILDGWWSRVAFPAFVTNWTALWIRPAPKTS
jgi:hypothetical protein